MAEVLDRRIKPWLPPQATEISLLSERSGHYARYKVEEADFMKFLDRLWEADKGSSAHKRDEMAAKVSQATRRAWRNVSKLPDRNLSATSVTYYSPSKPSGAMTTYYYDREAGIAYHDRGYW